MTVLVVTNDFPPRIGGIESFVAEACRFLDDDVVVLTSAAPGAAAWDADAAYPVHRLPGPLLPTPAVGRAAVALLRRSGADRVLFGAAAPLALLAPGVRAAGARRVVALTHGHEIWWSTLPGSRHLLRRIGNEVDVLTTISDYAAERIATALSRAGRSKLVRLPPPVDLELFRPQTAMADPGQAERPARRVIAVGRMVRRKGFDVLLDAWTLLGGTTDTTVSPENRRRPRHGHELVLVGDGPERAALERQVRRARLTGVRFTGALDRAAVAAELQHAHVFAFPVRTRLGGLDPEGLGLAPIEAAACGLPVVVGRSGGAPETVLPGQTGYVVDPDDPYELAARLSDLLAGDRARTLGAAGRRFVAERYGAGQARRVLRAALGLRTPGPSGVATV
jgi:phosphatidylinositol alpha-1,6-mannosyltransferase